MSVNVRGYYPKLTPYSITSMWLKLTNGGAEDGFEVATWVDPVRTQQAAKVVIGDTGAAKHAWDSRYESAYYSMYHPEYLKRSARYRNLQMGYCS